MPTINSRAGGGGGAYCRDRKAVVGGTSIAGVVGAGGAGGGASLGAGAPGEIRIREYSSNLPGVDVVNQLITQLSSLDPAVISGAIGTAVTGSPAISAPAKIPFNEFWSNKGGITYDAATRRFYLPSAGTYRVVLSGLNTGSTGNRVLVGLNNDAPGVANHRGVAYTNINNEGLSLESTFDVPANSYVVFYLFSGALNNLADNRLSQFSIERVTK